MCPTSTHDARRAPAGLPRSRHNLPRADNLPIGLHQSPPVTASPNPTSRPARLRVEVCAQNQLVQEALCRVLGKHVDIRRPEAKDPVDVLVLISQGSLAADLDRIRQIRTRAQGTKVLLVGSAKEDAEFLQYVRAGINGYLWRDASAEDIAQGVANVYAGKAVCPGELCAALFRFFEDAEPRLPFASPAQRLGLTRREQQIVPLIAKGFTNKEIANHFCLSEQTVKNHLYRMKHKIGADDRLSIVQKFRHHGFLL